MWLHNFWKKHVFEKPESRSKDQVAYWEGTFKGSTPLSPIKVSTDLVEGNRAINWLIEGI